MKEYKDIAAINLVCPTCGADDPFWLEPMDDDWITCNECGNDARWKVDQWVWSESGEECITPSN